MSEKNADKRSVSTDALETLGTLNLPEESGRDAIHVAVYPIIAPADLMPGEHVKADGTPTTMYDGVGIVDPFLSQPVPQGSRCWILLYPRTIKSLRHVWSHPGFPEEKGTLGDRSKAEARLRALCENWDGPDYDEFLELANDVNPGDDCIYYGTSGSGDIPGWVWEDIETVTGKKVAARPTYFTCSC